MNASKIEEEEILLDLIATLIMESRNTNQAKVDARMDNKEIWRRKKTTTRVEIHFNQDSSV